MLSTFMRPFKGATRNADDGDLLERNSEPTRRPASVRSYAQHRHATADFTEADDDDDESDDARQPHGNATIRGNEDEDGLNQAIGVLPLFSAGHLGMLSAVAPYTPETICVPRTNPVQLLRLPSDI